MRLYLCVCVRPVVGLVGLIATISLCVCVRPSVVELVGLIATISLFVRQFHDGERKENDR